MKSNPSRRIGFCVVVAGLSLVAIAASCEPPPPDEPPPPPVVLETPYEVTPATCDAGEVEVDSVGACTITITNVSDVDVNITGATSGPPFLALGANGPLAPGDSAVVTVNAVPRVAGVVEGELSLGPGRLIVPLVVEGVVSEAPDVIVTVSPADVVTGDTVTLDSGAPADDIVEWSLVTLPAASSTTLDATTEAVVTFVPDVAGDYTFAVAATDVDGVRAEGTVTVTARAPRDLTLTTTAGVLHFRPRDAFLCSDVDCFAGACDVELGSGPRQSPAAVGGGILVDDLPVGTFRVAVVLADGEAAVSPTVSAFVQGALADDVTFALEPGDAHEAFDIVVADDGTVTIEEVGATVVDGAC